jgi:hypothetical protein
VAYAAGGEALSVAVGDFDGDGNPDLAVAIGSGGSILMGNGDGTFGPPVVVYPAGPHPTFVVVGDFNGEWKPDLAVANDIREFSSCWAMETGVSNRR